MDGGNRNIYNILIAEDDSLMKDMYISWLSDILKDNSGVIVSIISNGREVSECLSRKNYDLTILDVALPNVSGIDLYRQYGDKMGKILLASSYADLFSKYLNDTDKCIILNKPFNKSDLKEFLNSISEVPLNANTRTDSDVSEYIFI